MHGSLREFYTELRESGSVSDFPLILRDAMHTRLLDLYREKPAAWKTWTLQSEQSDFRPSYRSFGSESPDLNEIVDGLSEYQDTKLTDYEYSLTLKTYGIIFSLDRRTMINDSKGFFKQTPERLARAAHRSVAKHVVTTLEANGNCFDGNALFSASHTTSNLASGGGSTLTEANVQTAIQTLRNMTDVTSNKIQVQPRYLLVPPQLEFTGRRILNSELVVSGQTTPIGNSNTVQGTLELVVEPFLTSATAWYVLADPNEYPAVEIAFLDGKAMEPEILVQDVRMVGAGGSGGAEAFDYDFDIIRWKMRYDYQAAVGVYYGCYKGVGA